MSDLLLFADLDNRKLVSRDGGAVTMPSLILGDSLRCSLRFFERTEQGDIRETDLAVRTVRAAIGRVSEPPTSGTVTFTLDAGAALGAVNPATTAAQMLALINAGALSAAEVELAAPACWLIRFTVDAEVDFAVATNLLRPAAFPRWRAFQQGGLWWHELRLVQYPIAWNEGGQERVLPDPPTVSEILEGRVGTITEPAIDELQALHLPNDFRGTYFLRWEGYVSSVLGIEDGPEEIAAALNAMFPDGRTRFIGSNPEADYAYIRFTGPLAGSPQPLITTEVNTFQPGVLTFVLPLDRPEAYGALRTATTADLFLELELEIVDDPDDLDEPGVPGRIITLAQQAVKLVREQIFEELATVPAIDWLRPSIRDYVPFTPDQIITGVQQAYATNRGDGVATDFVCDHGLATAAIKGVTVTAAATGIALVHGTDFAWTVNNTDTVTVTALGAAPAAGAWDILISAAGPASAFQAHTHTIAQIVGLQAALDAITGRLDNVEALLPSAPATRDASIDATKQTIVIPNRREFFPGRFPLDFDQSSSSLTAALLRRPPMLLPALHVASVTNVATDALPVSPSAGVVYAHTGSARVLVPGAGGRKSSYWEVGGFLAWDSRGFFYRLTKDLAPSTTTTYAPTDFERELFKLAVNDQMLRAGQRLSMSGKIDLALYAGSTQAQVLLVCEVGTVPSQSSPSTTGENLSDVTWNTTTPLLTRRIILTDLLQSHEFGAELVRDSIGDFTSSALLYGKWEAGAAIPSDPNFAIRFRLIQWDTENAASLSATNARGYLHYAMREASGVIY